MEPVYRSVTKGCPRPAIPGVAPGQSQAYRRGNSMENSQLLAIKVFVIKKDEYVIGMFIPSIFLIRAVFFLPYPDFYAV